MSTDVLINGKTRYSDEELLEFRGLILNKLCKAQQDFILLKESLQPVENGINDKDWKEDSSLFRTNNNKLLEPKREFINSLVAALVRIENKTYGICRQTGKLIPKERLLAVPHATLCVEEKNGNKNGHKNGRRG